MTSGPAPQGKLNAIADISAVHYPVKISKCAELTTAAKRTPKPCYVIAVNTFFFFKWEMQANVEHAEKNYRFKKQYSKK